jgi:hypothetical protein
MDRMLRRNFLLSSGAMALAGCAGGASAIMPRSTNSASSPSGTLRGSTLTFSNEHYSAAVGAKADGSVHITVNGNQTITIAPSAKSGIPVFTRGSTSHALLLPSSARDAQWYTNKAGTVFQRFNSANGRVEVSDGATYFAALGVATKGMVFGLRLGDSKGPRAAISISNEQISDCIEQAQAIVLAAVPRPKAVNASIAARFGNFDTFAKAKIAEAAARKTQDEIITTCYTASVITTGGSVLASRQTCNEYLITTGTGSPTSTGAPSPTPPPIWPCIQHYVLAYFASTAVNELLAALGSSIQVSTLIAAIGEGVLAVVSLLTPVLLAGLSAILIYELASQLYEAYEACTAS